jgi:O-antigen/teichoic acid export membrane protein
MTGAEWRAARITLITGAASAAANFVLALKYGTVGVAIGASASIAIWNVWLCAAAHRHTGILAVPAFPRVRRRK